MILERLIATIKLKSHRTAKAVTCVAPNGALVCCSEPIDLCRKEFIIFDKLPSGVTLNIPPFHSSKSHFTKEEAQLCYNKIERSQIHVERANE